MPSATMCTKLHHGLFPDMTGMVLTRLYRNGDLEREDTAVDEVDDTVRRESVTVRVDSAPDD